MTADAIASYFRRFGAREYIAECNTTGRFAGVVVIPALAEMENCGRLLQSLTAANSGMGSILTLFVVNNTTAASDAVKAENRKTLDLLREALPSATLPLGVIDAASAGYELPEKDGGVGLARKAGLDAALRLLTPGAYGAFLACLDADCTVAPNYFSALSGFFGNGAQVLSLGFSHRMDEAAGEERDAILCYEIFLRYYVTALAWSGSPFGFHTIGSSMAFTPEAYIKTEGMNKRKAGEDFYFLQKAAKNFPILSTPETLVFPSPRGSWRVPFGTGQRVNRFLTGQQNEYLLYPFTVFDALRQWHAVYYGTATTAGGYITAAHTIAPALAEFLETQGFAGSWERITRQVLPPEQLQKQKRGWFDGFRTLKCVHYLRDNGFGMQPMFAALPALLRACGIAAPPAAGVPPVPVQEQRLSQLIAAERRLVAGCR